MYLTLHARIMNDSRWKFSFHFHPHSSSMNGGFIIILGEKYKYFSCHGVFQETWQHLRGRSKSFLHTSWTSKHGRLRIKNPRSKLLLMAPLRAKKNNQSKLRQVAIILQVAELFRWWDNENIFLSFTQCFSH